MKYPEQLKTKEWKLKRDKIIARDKCCQKCTSISKLEVHHIYYEFNRMAWDYPDEALITFCKGCHKKEHEDIKSVKNVIAEMYRAGFFAEEIINRMNVDCFAPTKM